MPHRRRLHVLVPPLPLAHTAYDLTEPDSRLPLLADYACINSVDAAPTGVPLATQWSTGSSPITTTGTKPATASTATATGSSMS